MISPSNTRYIQTRLYRHIMPLGRIYHSYKYEYKTYSYRLQVLAAFATMDNIPLLAALFSLWVRVISLCLFLVGCILSFSSLFPCFIFRLQCLTCVCYQLVCSIYNSKLYCLQCSSCTAVVLHWNIVWPGIHGCRSYYTTTVLRYTAVVLRIVLHQVSLPDY